MYIFLNFKEKYFSLKKYIYIYFEVERYKNIHVQGVQF